jgi:peptide deformylase
LATSDIVVQGNPKLTEPSKTVVWPDPHLEKEIVQLHDTLTEFQIRHGYGRAIAASQLGILKRLVAMNLGAGPLTLINPEIVAASDERFTVWDDCMSVPDHVVRVERHRMISVCYTDELGRRRTWRNIGASLGELLQHEIDHLDGRLMLDRAVDGDSIQPISRHSELVEAGRPSHRLSLDAIAEAAETVDPVFRSAPQYQCEPLSEILGCHLTLKVETVNPIRSFKGRGADYFMSKVIESGDDRPLVCASAGNFGQAMAYVAGKHRRSLVVYTSENANPLKVERMRGLGAEVRVYGDDFDAAKAEAKRHCEESGARLVEDGRDPEISEGAGSIGVELLATNQLYDFVTVPLGNGALLNGIARWFKAASPATETIGVSSAGADAMEKSWRLGEIVDRQSVDTIADGIAVRAPIPEAVEDMRGTVDDVVLVDDQQIIEAMRLLHRHAGLVTEPAGAVGVAALLADPGRFSGRQIASVIAGSNLTLEGIRTYLQD